MKVLLTDKRGSRVLGIEDAAVVSGYRTSSGEADFSQAVAKLRARLEAGETVTGPGYTLAPAAGGPECPSCRDMLALAQGIADIQDANADQFGLEDARHVIKTLSALARAAIAKAEGRG